MCNKYSMNTTLLEVQELLSEKKGKEDVFYALCESPSLRLKKILTIGENTKKTQIDAVVTCQKAAVIKLQKKESLQSAINFTPPGSVQFEAKLEARLIVDHSGGILENANICLHRHFGTPYIPGSALKGISRHAAWCEWNDLSEGEEKRQCAENIAAVFGYPTNDSSGEYEGIKKEGLDDYLIRLSEKKYSGKAYAGTVSFLAAHPKQGDGLLVTDIVNCHHPEYYGERQYEAFDNESPNPQFFPAVEAGSTFRFTICPLRVSGDRAENLLTLAKKWLAKGLTENGVGAKTSAGYGWFNYDPEAEARREQGIKEEERKKKEQEERDAAEAERIREKQKLEKELAEMTPEQRADHEVDGFNADALQHRMLNFDDPKKGPAPEIKAAIVRALRGSRLADWDEFKRKATKGKLATAANAIRAYCKNEMNLGKMP